ncbi:MAG: oligoendopeptidase F, partial [Ktedonobacteraceae bacterium]
MPKITLPQRSELRQEDTWNAASVFPTLAVWETEYQQVQAQLPMLAQYQGRLSLGSATLVEALEAFLQIRNRASKLLVYASISSSVDSTDQASAALASKSISLIGQVRSAGAFLNPEILALAPETLQNWLREDERVASYAHYLDDLRREQTHVR